MIHTTVLHSFRRSLYPRIDFRLLDISKLYPDKSHLIALFANRSMFLTQVLQKLTQHPDQYFLIIDTNHRWDSSALGPHSYVIQPNTRRELMNILLELDTFINPRLTNIIIDDLPLYFRDFYHRDQLQTQNMRAYGACLALLSEIALKKPVLFSTYSSGINHEEPILLSHTTYFCDKIYLVTSKGSTGIEFRDLDTNSKISLNS